MMLESAGLLEENVKTSHHSVVFPVVPRVIAMDAFGENYLYVLFELLRIFLISNPNEDVRK